MPLLLSVAQHKLPFPCQFLPLRGLALSFLFATQLPLPILKGQALVQAQNVSLDIEDHILVVPGLPEPLWPQGPDQAQGDWYICMAMVAAWMAERRSCSRPGDGSPDEFRARHMLRTAAATCRLCR